MNSEASEGGAGGILLPEESAKSYLVSEMELEQLYFGADELLGGEKALERTNYERSRERHTQVGWEH